MQVVMDPVWVVMDPIQAMLDPMLAVRDPVWASTHLTIAKRRAVD